MRVSSEKDITKAKGLLVIAEALHSECYRTSHRGDGLKS